MQSTTIAVDLAKSVFEVAVSRRPGNVAERRRLSRGQFSRFLADQAPATIVMEACGTAHFWGREADACGHRVVLLPPHAMRPYVLRNKTDGADAKGLLEAVRNEGIRAVPVKSVDQHVLASLHRMRSAWMATPRGSTPCEVCYASSGLRSRWVRARSCRRCGPWPRTPTPGSPMRCGPCSPRRRARSASSKRAFARSSARSRRWRARVMSWCDCARFRAWAYSPPRLSWPSSVTCSASLRDVTWRVISGSHLESRRVAYGDTWARSASGEIPI